jgi:hypothetical protein
MGPPPRRRRSLCRTCWVLTHCPAWLTSASIGVLSLRICAWGSAVGENTVIIQVPAADRPDLEALASRLGAGPGDLLGSQAFDGASVLTLLVSISAGTAAVLRTWLLARANVRKSTKAIIEGKHFEGYTKDEVLAIMKALRQPGAPGVPGAPGAPGDGE